MYFGLSYFLIYINSREKQNQPNRKGLFLAKDIKYMYFLTSFLNRLQQYQMSLINKKRHQRFKAYKYKAIIFNLPLTVEQQFFFYTVFIPAHFHEVFTIDNIKGSSQLRITIMLYWLIIKSAFSTKMQYYSEQCLIPPAEDLLIIVKTYLKGIFPEDINKINSLFVITYQDVINGFEQCNREDILQFYAEKQRQLIQMDLKTSLTTKYPIKAEKNINAANVSKIMIDISSFNQTLLPQKQYVINFSVKGSRQTLKQTMRAYILSNKKYEQPNVIKQLRQFQETINFGMYEKISSQSSMFYYSYSNKKTTFFRNNNQFISIITLINHKLTIKIDIQFNSKNIKEIVIFYKDYILFLLKKQPKFYVQYLTNEMSIKQLSKINKWHSISNFPIEYNENLRKNRLKSQIFNKNMAIMIKCSCKDTSNTKIIIEMCKRTNILTNRLFEKTQHIEYLPCQKYSIKTGENLNTYISKYKDKIVSCFYHHPQKDKKRKQYQQLFLISHFIQLDYSLSIENGVHKKADQIIEELQQKYQMRENPTFATMTQFMKEMYQKLHNQKAYLGFNQEPQVPRRQELKIFKIYNVALTPTGTVYKGYTNEFSCRVLREFRPQVFIKVTFCDNDLKPILASTKKSDNNYIIQSVFKNQLSGFTISSVRYVPLGWSNSQIKRSQIWFVIDHCLFNGDQNGAVISLRDDIYNFLGNFQDVDAGKRPSRIGQSFGNSQSITFSKLIQYPIQLEQIQTQVIIDPKNQNIKRKYKFSDGIGQISKCLLEKIKEQLKLSKDVCSLQIRFLGYKGVLTLGSHSYTEKYQVRMPKSMKKYQCKDPRALNHFDVMSWNKYCPGFLNCQIILLLLARGIHVTVILGKMQQFINREVYGLDFTEDTLINHFRTHLQTSPINEESLFDLLNCFLETKDPELSSLIHSQVFFCQLLAKVKRQLSLKIKNKLRFRIQQAARLMGILDFYHILKQGEVYCKIRKHQKRSSFTINTKAFIAKNPCLHPSDIRIVKCVSDNELKARLRKKGLDIYSFEELVNVIVFPQQGTYPLSATISGGDLDGDYYILCWDQDLIPQIQSQQHLYDDGIIKEQQEIFQLDLDISICSQREEHKKNPISQQTPKNYDNLYGLKEMFQFFLEYLKNNRIGLISRYHLLWAENRGAWSSQCIQLAKIHAAQIDYSKKGVRPNLQIPIPPKEYKKYNQKALNEQPTNLSSLYGLALRKFKQNQKEKGLQAKISNQLNWVFSVGKFGYFDDQVESAMRTLQSYKNDIEESLRNKNMFNSSEFVIYHGRDENLIADSIAIKQKYKLIFFKDSPKQLEIYEKHQIQAFFDERFPYFHYETIKKAFLWHIISNSMHLMKTNIVQWKYIEIVREAAQKILKMKDDYLKLLKSGWFGVFYQIQDDNHIVYTLQNAEKFTQEKKQKIKSFENVYGLCWNVIPKVMVFLVRNLQFFK